MMAILELGMVIGAIVERNVEGAWEKAKRHEAVIRVLQKVGLKPNDPPSDFAGVYAYTLVEYGVGKPKPILDFFRHEFIRDAFRQSFEKRDPSILNEEAERLIEWHKVGDDLRQMGIDPRREFARFTAVFNEIVDRTRTSAEVRQDQKLDDIYDALHLRTGKISELSGRFDTLDEIRQEAAAWLAKDSQSRQFVVAPTGEKLKVFISSKMAELRDVREIVRDTLRTHGFEAFVYEESAGARPETVVATSLQEVEEADIYVGLFWQKYGEVTVEEYRYARKCERPCFVYIRDKDLSREPKLEAFLEAEVYDPTRGVTYYYFDSVLQLGNTVVSDIMAWWTRHYRKLLAQSRAAEVSWKKIDRLTKEMLPSPPDPVVLEIIK